MSQLSRPDAEVAYEVGGEGHGLVTFLHGFTQRGDAWAEVIGMLPAGRRWLTLDLRGHGRSVESPSAGVTMEACADDVLAAWDLLRVDRGHVVGYSMGARLALHMAARHPDRVRSLTAVAPHAGLRDPVERARRLAADNALAARIEADGVAWFAEYWSALPIFAGLSRRGPDYVAEVRRRRLDNRPQGLAASLRGMGLGAMERLWDDLGVAAMPALLVAGAEDDRAAVTAEIAAALPSAELDLFDITGHCVQMERPADFAARLAGFLDRVDSGHGATR